MGCSCNNGIEVKDDNIQFTNKSLFDKKLSDFSLSYKKNCKSVAIITDFDYTITVRYDYNTKEEFKSSYYLYDATIIGGDMEKFADNTKKLRDEYFKYEFDTSYDYETRFNKMKEWYTRSLESYFSEKFNSDSVDKMVEKCKKNIKFRKSFKEYFELLISMGITFIIISGGITQFIIGALKMIEPNIEKYIEEKKVLIVSNTFLFDQKKGCCGLQNEVIFCFNKADFLGNIVKELLPDLKNIFVLGDHLNDPDSVKKLNVPDENITGMGFLNLAPDDLNDPKKESYVKEKINESKKVYDMTLVGNCDYSHILDYIKKIKN